MTKSKIYPAIVLGGICLVVALLLSGINFITAPIIAARADALADSAKSEVLPGSSGFKDIINDFDFPASITEAYSADIGFVFRSSGSGRNGEIVIMVGVSKDGKITGTKIITEAESKGYKEKVYGIVEGTEGQYTGQTLDGFTPVIAAGATMTSNGFAEAVKTALQAYTIAAGGSVDLRTPEQILQDNCNVALGTDGKTFTKWFATEVVEDIDAVYETDNGRVYVIGESFVGIKADGTVASADASADDQAKATAADAIINASKCSEITNLPGGLGAEITKVFVTNSGNYIFELSAKGYDVSFEYSDGHMPGNTPQPIEIKLSISAEGKIIDCMTVKHNETAGVGDACASDDYTKQWSGATNEDVTVVLGIPSHSSDLVPEGSTDLGAISGATYTTQGYQKAVKSAFAAFELLTASEGGND